MASNTSREIKNNPQKFHNNSRLGGSPRLEKSRFKSNDKSPSPNRYINRYLSEKQKANSGKKIANLSKPV